MPVTAAWTGSRYVDGLLNRSSSTPRGRSSSLSDADDVGNDVGDDVSSCRSHDAGDGDVISLLSPLAAASLCFCRRNCSCHKQHTNYDYTQSDKWSRNFDEKPHRRAPLGALKIVPSPGGSMPPPNTLFLGPTWVYNPNSITMTGWQPGIVVSMSEVNPHQARLVLAWATSSGGYTIWNGLLCADVPLRNCSLTHYTISVCNQPTRLTQPCIPPGSLNQVPASAVVRAGMSLLPGGR